jgi:hypothetical protein
VDRELPNIRADVRSPSSAILLAVLLLPLCSQQPGLRLQQYKVLRIRLQIPVLIYAPSLGFALQTIPKVA